MTNKQIIIENYFNIMRDDNGRIYCIQDIGDSKELIKAIREQNEYIQRKEQECEELKKQLTILDDEDVVVEITVKQFEEYKKLKAENKHLSELLNQALKDYDRTLQTLEEIKEIAEPFCNACQEFEPEKKGRNCIYCNYGKILQKISEVEDES